jgi:hypothetical protein
VKASFEKFLFLHKSTSGRSKSKWPVAIPDNRRSARERADWPFVSQISDGLKVES